VLAGDLACLLAVGGAEKDFLARFAVAAEAIERGCG
jgi:hypothetical protein